jgi:hypothetical protein
MDLQSAAMHLFAAKPKTHRIIGKIFRPIALEL